MLTYLNEKRPEAKAKIEEDRRMFGFCRKEPEKCAKQLYVTVAGSRLSFQGTTGIGFTIQFSDSLKSSRFSAQTLMDARSGSKINPEIQSGSPGDVHQVVS